MIHLVEERFRRQLYRDRGWWIVLVLIVALAAMGGIRSSTAGVAQETLLDKTMLKLELPHSKSEMRSVVPPAAARWWSYAQWWDFLFIAAYVALFVILSVPDLDENPPAWDSPLVCIAVAGLCDCCENISLLLCLRNIENLHDPGPRSFIALTFFGACKWLFFFLACRALAIRFGHYPKLLWAAVSLRGLATAGAWATVLALVGLSSRPIVTVSMTGVVFVLLPVLYQRWRLGPQPTPPAAPVPSFSVS